MRIVSRVSVFAVLLWFLWILAAAALLFVTLGAEPTMILGCAICLVLGLYVGIIVGKDLP
jgi:hypothetical protein